MPETITATLNARLSSLLAELDACYEELETTDDDAYHDRLLERVGELAHEIEAAGTDLTTAEELARGAYTTCGHEDFPCCGCDQ